MTHQLENKELVYAISKWLYAIGLEDTSRKFNEFIKTKQYELAEQICRHYYIVFCKFGYKITAGKVHSFNSKRVFHINSKGQRHGDYMNYDGSNVLVEHHLYVNGVLKKNYLKNIK